jgi:hypothetical protein
MLQMRSPLSPATSAGYNPLSAAKSLFGSPSKQGYHPLQEEGGAGSPSLSPYRLPLMGVLEVAPYISPTSPLSLPYIWRARGACS